MCFRLGECSVNRKDINKSHRKKGEAMRDNVKATHDCMETTQKHRGNKKGLRQPPAYEADSC